MEILQPKRDSYALTNSLSRNRVKARFTGNSLPVLKRQARKDEIRMGMYKPAIISTKGKWIIVGSVPVELCVEKMHYGQKYLVPKIFDTKEEAEVALQAVLNQRKGN